MLGAGRGAGAASNTSPTAPAHPPLDHLAVMRRWRDWRRGRRPPPTAPSPLSSSSPSPLEHRAPPAPLLLLAPMEGLADRPMRVALAKLQRRAAARLLPGDPRSDSPAAVAAARAILLLRQSGDDDNDGDDRDNNHDDDTSSLFSSPGFDEACQEFIRVPGALSPGARMITVARGVCRSFRRDELGATPLAAQLMGSDPLLMAAAARQLVSAPCPNPPRRRRREEGYSDGLVDGRMFGGRSAAHVSLNCGCPANTVTGHGAGSSLLRDPRALEALVASMRGAVDEAGGANDGCTSPPFLSVKVRAGFDDASLFGDNALAARDGGAAALVVHPRTKRQAYRGRADWALVDRARRLLEEENDQGGGGAGGVPVVGNGDVVRASDALALALSTGCSGVMVGRGAVQDPLIFLRVRAAFGALAHLREEERGGRLSGERDELLLRAGNGGDGGAARASPLVREASAAAARGVRFGGEGGEAALIESFLRDYVALADAETRAKRGGGRGSAARAGGDDDGGGGEPGGGGKDGEGDERGRLGRLKSVLKYLFTGQPRLRRALPPMLRVLPERGSSECVLELACAAVRLHWRDGGPDAATPLVSHMRSVEEEEEEAGRRVACR